MSTPTELLASTEVLPARERIPRLPNDFSSLPDTIRLGDMISPKQELNPHKESVTRRFLQMCFRHTELERADGEKIIPHSVTDRRSGANYTLVVTEPHFRHDDSVGSSLFYSSLPIYGLVAESLRFLRAQRTDGNPKSACSESISWSDVIYSIFNEYRVFDHSGTEVLPSGISVVITEMIGAQESQRVSWDQNRRIKPLSEIIRDYLSVWFDLEIDLGSAKCFDPSKLTVPIGSAQRAVTPFCFGNCKEGCRFCYVDQGAGSIRYPNRWERSMTEIDAALQAFDPVSGRGYPQPKFAFMDWEPTEHPHFLSILKEIAQRDPENQIPIVTHGGSLTRELLLQIASDPLLKKLVLFQVSLNSANINLRRTVMAGVGNHPQHHENAIQSLPLMRELGIAFDVSIVATTNWLPLDDILETIRYADKYKPHSYIRVALPTATKDHPPEMLLSDEDLRNIDKTVIKLRDELDTPIVVTVGLLNRSGLNAVTEGVMPNSPAAKAGVTHGCEIVSVDGQIVRSRTEATTLLGQRRNQCKDGAAQSCIIVVKSPNNIQFEVDLAQYPDIAPRSLGEKEVGVYGLLLHDDIDFGIFQSIRELQHKHKLRSPLMVTSTVMIPFFEQALTSVRDDEKVKNLSIIPAQNNFFGGNVGIAGLLTCSDVLSAIAKSDVLSSGVDAIFLSAAMFSKSGFDLEGYHFRDLACALGLPVFIIKSRTGSL